MSRPASNSVVAYLDVIIAYFYYYFIPHTFYFFILCCFPPRHHSTTTLTIAAGCSATLTEFLLKTAKSNSSYCSFQSRSLSCSGLITSLLLLLFFSLPTRRVRNLIYDVNVIYLFIIVIIIAVVLVNGLL